MNSFEKIVELLLEKNKTISCMESCTGGAFANALTSIPNSSLVFHFGAVTYSNEYKIKMGVDKSTIDKYTVYSKETAKEMARAISVFSNANYGIGVTGQINKQDPNNPYGEVGKVFYCIYDTDNKKYYEYEIIVNEETRNKNKEVIISDISNKIIEVID